MKATCPLESSLAQARTYQKNRSSRVASEANGPSQTQTFVCRVVKDHVVCPPRSREPRWVSLSWFGPSFLFPRAPSVGARSEQCVKRPLRGFGWGLSGCWPRFWNPNSLVQLTPLPSGFKVQVWRTLLACGELPFQETVALQGSGSWERAKLQAACWGFGWGLSSCGPPALEPQQPGAVDTFVL